MYKNNNNDNIKQQLTRIIITNNTRKLAIFLQTLTLHEK